MKVHGKPGRRLAFEDESRPETVDTARTLDPRLAAGVWHRRAAVLDHSGEIGLQGLEALYMLFKPMVIG